jgi:hypothetical protein
MLLRIMVKLALLPVILGFLICLKFADRQFFLDD